MIKEIINMFKPTKIIFKDFNTWEDIGQWDDFNNMGRTIFVKK